MESLEIAAAFPLQLLSFAFAAIYIFARANVALRRVVLKSLYSLSKRSAHRELFTVMADNRGESLENGFLNVQIRRIERLVVR